ncbi:Nitrate regulatory gene2 protein, partial [Mucuna pruriens]
MGCNNSRLDGLPAVALCRDRCKFVDEALRQSYAVADAHSAHMHSLNTLASSLSQFFHHFEFQLELEPISISNSNSNLPLQSQFIDAAATRYDSSPSPSPPHYHYSLYTPSPPLPTASPWDFLNVFENLDKYQIPYSPTHNHLKENQKEKINQINSDSLSPKEPSTNSPSPKPLSDAIKEIHILFQRASQSGNPILEMLDVGKLHPCKMMHAFTPSKHLNCMESTTKYQGIDIDKGLGYGNLCSTLNKLCMWEKKLHVEVKAGEKLRALHEKKCRQLSRMNKKGADAHTVDSVETLIGILATKIKISFQVVDKISSTICKLMEEELWPQINKFIFRFLGMWKEMLECYRSQYKEIAEAKSLEISWFSRKPSNSGLDELIKLKSEVQNWNLSFSDWIYTQKAHVKALNGWLVRCLPYEPEEILDGTPPFSPARIGAPPVFVICTKWSRAMDILSEKDVIEAVNGFMLKLNELLEKHVADLQQKLTLDKELERKVKILEREEQKMHKVVQARERKMSTIARENNDVLLRGDAVHHADLVDIMSLQSGLKHIFAAMERFTATIACVYEELCQQITEDNHVL